MRAVALVNGNARRVRGTGLRAKLEQALPGRVRFTTSLADARAVVRDEVAKGLDLLILGGGDGTVVLGLKLLEEACRGAHKPEPAIGVLRLGSGNAFADTASATTDPVDDLARLARGDGVWRPLPLVSALGVRAPFVGLGADAQLLEDHAEVNRLVNLVPGAKRFVGGGARYVLSVALRSVPRFALEKKARVTVTNLGAPAIEMGKDGETGVVRERGAVLWTGDCTLVTCATIPNFGFGLRLFPYADRRADRFQLRCGDGSLFEVLKNVPASFRGDYFSKHTSDHLCDRVCIEVDRDAAIEAGGELLGRHEKFEVGLATPATLVSLDG